MGMNKGRLLPIAQSLAELETNRVEQHPDLNWLREQFAVELDLLRQETISAAQKNADEIAKKELQKNMAQLQQSYEKQLTALQQQTEEQVSFLSRAIADVKVSREQLIDGAEICSLELAFTALCKLLGEHYLDKQILAGVVRETLAQSKTLITPVIRVSRDDHNNLLSFESLAEWSEHLQVDESLEISSCVIDLGNKRLDASLMQQLDALRQTLVSIYEQRQHALPGA